MFNKRRRSAGKQVGCGFLFWTGVAMLSLFVVNNLVVRILFSANLENTDERLFQAAQFLLPIGMLLVEYWFIDWLLSGFRRLRDRNGNK